MESGEPKEPTIEKLLKSWREFVEKTGVNEEKAESVFNDLISRYKEKARAYHNLEHILQSLDLLNEIRDKVKNLEELRFAFFEHDAVYDPKKSDNEEKSADLSDEHSSQLGLPKEFSDKVRRFILLSQHGKLIPETDDEKFFVDIDLSILGANDADFDLYENQIREEYKHVGDEDFRKGRSEFIKSILARDYIFSTSYFRDRFEKQARANLKRSLQKWSRS